MASTTKSLRSSTANKRPTTAIADGQIALNTNATSPGLYFKDSTGASIIKIGPVHVSTTAPNVAPGAGGSAGNSTGETWLDTSLTPNGWKVWTGAAWVNATPVGSATVQGLLELATDAETQTGSDTARAVTPAGLQSKVSDSTSTTSSTTIASSTAVKSAYDLANAALPKSGGTVTGNLEIGNTGSLTFEGATADAFETTLAVVDPTADRTITLPNATGIVVLDNNGQTVQFGLGAVATPSITFTGDTNTGIYSPAADTLAFAEGGVEAMRIDSSARLLVGASTARANFSNVTASAALQLEGTANARNLAIIADDASAPGSAVLILAKQRSGGVGGNTIVQSGDSVGTIIFEGSDGSEFVDAASIEAFVDGTPGANDMPGRLVFSTTDDGASSPTERMRIWSGGGISTGRGVRFGSFSADPGDTIIIQTTVMGPGAGTYPLKWNAGTGVVTYDSSSRLVKENIVDCPYGINTLKQLRPRKYFRLDDQREEIGFVADEVVDLMPEFVPVGPKSVITRNEDDTEEVPLGVNYDKLTAVLTKALQEAIVKIESLEARLTAAGIE